MVACAAACNVSSMFHRDGPTLRELVEQALSSTERGYDLLAPKFDRTPFRTPDEVLREIPRYLGGPASVERALDVCCGTGAAMRFLRPLCRDMVVGVDVSRGMMAEARRRLADAEGTAKLEFVRADALRMPFDEAFDVATCFGAFGHILEDDEPHLVVSVARALRPGGRFVFVTSEMPPVSSPALWLARGFNAAMRVRNALIKPEFVMYYLTFLLPRCRRLLESQGFDVVVHDDVFDRPFGALKLVVATRR